MPTPLSVSSRSAHASTPDSCLSLASTLRCYYSSEGSELHHSLLIIPVALEVIFSTSLIFTNWASGRRRHIFLVVEGWIYFLLALIEVLSFVTPAVQDNIAFFKSVDQTIGALSFLQILFYMAFLYAFVRAECLSIIPFRIQRIARLLLLLSIPIIITMNTVASFPGISYVLGPNHIEATFHTDRDNFIWTFFSAITLALFTLFQASCFCFAFYRLVRAFLKQRNIESDSKDAAVLFKGIGWINAGIKLGAIETVIGFVFFGIPIAYIRRVIRFLGRALLCIGVAKGVDAMEDFEVIRGELDSGRSSAKGFRRSRLRGLISNPRLSTFHQLSPTAAAFHAKPRAPLLAPHSDRVYDEKRHPYSGEGLTIKKSIWSSYDASPILFREKLVLPPPAPAPASGSAGLTGMKEFAQIKAQRMSQYSSKSPSHVTIQYEHGTPSLHLRFSQVELPTPAVIAQDIRTPTNESLAEYKKAHGYPDSSTRERTIESENLYRYGTHPYGDSSSESSHSLYSPSDKGVYDTPRTSRTLGYGPPDLCEVLEPPTPAYRGPPTQRSSRYSQVSDLSAAQAEIIDTPRRKLSFLSRKSAVARAMLYPVPGTKVALALSGTESSPVTLPTRPPNPTAMTPRSTIDAQLPPTRRASPLPAPPMQRSLTPESRVSQRQQQQQASTIVSVVGNHASEITINNTEPSPESPGYSSDEPKTRSLTLQAMRDLAEQFPGPPPGAVVANIGIQAASINRRNEEGPTDHGFDESRNGSSHGHGTSIAASTDTEEAIRRRIPANMKMKGRQASPAPSVPPLPLPIQDLPRAFPRQLSRPVNNPQIIPHMQSLEQVLSQAQAPPHFTAQPIDPFEDDDTTSYPETANELSPLSMSIKLRHPQSFISTMYPSSTRRNSKVTTTGFMSPDPTTSPSVYSQGLSRGPSTYGHKSPSILDFGVALKEWNLAGLQTMGVPLTGAATHRRSLSAQTRSEFERQQQKLQKGTTLTSELDLSDDLPDQQPRQPIRATGRDPLSRIKSIGKAPQRTTPRPIKSSHARESMHLQHLVIPASPAGQDVPVSAVEAGGVPQIFGVNKAGVHLTLEEQDELMPMSAVTEGPLSTHGGDMMRSLSIMDGGHVPIRLQRSQKEFY